VLSGEPKYLALYEARDAGVMPSGPYLALKKHRDARTLRCTPLFRKTIKGTCDVVSRAGEGEGVLLALLLVTVDAANQPRFRDWACKELLPDVVQCRDVLASTFAERRNMRLDVSAAHDVRTGDRYLERAILIEAGSERGAETALVRLNASVLARHGARPHLVDKACAFRTLYTLRAAAMEKSRYDR
jgi:hypothetical protein